MIIDTREEYLKRIGERIGDTPEDLSFLEDMTDTYDALNTGSDRAEIERLTAENDELRRKYKERFFKPSQDPEEDGEKEPEKVMSSFDDLFK